MSPRNGSINGGTLITITGKYLYTDNDVPAAVKIGGQTCKVKGFNQDDYLKTRITCETAIYHNSTEYFGNRGITLYQSDTFTNDLVNTVRPINEEAQIIDEFSYSRTSVGTVFLTGFLVPGKSSNYTLSIVSDANAALFISSDGNSSNKILAATVNNPTTVSLEANTEYE